MSTTDNVIFNTYERAVSDDSNDLQSLLSRQTMEAFQAVARRTLTGGNPIGDVRDHIASGLNCKLVTGNVVVETGVLGQLVSASPPDVPAPGALDSSYRIGFLFADETMADPYDGTQAWWLLQGRVERDLTLQETRDIYNPGTQTFVATPNIDKRYESVVVLEWKKGTSTTIASPDAGYATIGAVYRNTGGPAITADDIVTLSVQVDDVSNHTSNNGSVKRTNFRFYTNNGEENFSTGVGFNLSGEVNGKKLLANAAPLDLETATFVSPDDVGLIGTARVWWYVYLYAPTDMMPSNLYGSGIEHRGCLVVSRVAPDENGSNSATITVPNPIGGTIAANTAVHLAVFSKAAGIFYDFISIRSCGAGRVDKREFNLGGGGSFIMNAGNTYQQGTHNLATSGAGATEDVPYGVALEGYIETDVLDNTATAFALEVLFQMQRDSSISIVSSFAHHITIPEPYSAKFWLEPAHDSSNLTIRVIIQQRTNIWATTAFSGAAFGTVAFEAGLYSIRF